MTKFLSHTAMKNHHDMMTSINQSRAIAKSKKGMKPPLILLGSMFYTNTFYASIVYENEHVKSLRDILRDHLRDLHYCAVLFAEVPLSG